jgi:hypothetical protein
VKDKILYVLDDIVAWGTLIVFIIYMTAKFVIEYEETGR